MRQFVEGFNEEQNVFVGIPNWLRNAFFYKRDVCLLRPNHYAVQRVSGWRTLCLGEIRIATCNLPTPWNFRNQRHYERKNAAVWVTRSDVTNWNFIILSEAYVFLFKGSNHFRCRSKSFLNDTKAMASFPRNLTIKVPNHSIPCLRPGNDFFGLEGCAVHTQNSRIPGAYVHLCICPISYPSYQ
jgi:hypothetical protein